MKRIYYVFCPTCQKNYYIERELYLKQKQNPSLRLMCPYCHAQFSGRDAQFVEE
jgi:hypothetical protein